MTNPIKKKICFIAREFGKGRGEVATYLFNMARMLIDHHGFDIYVLADEFDPTNPILKELVLRKFNDSDTEILAALIEIQPDFVELGDCFSYGYKALLHKALGFGLLNTTFVVNHHMNTRNFFEWSEEIPFCHAPSLSQGAHVYERAKSYLADRNIAPSNFMCNYLNQHFGIPNVEIFRYVHSPGARLNESCAEQNGKISELSRDLFCICCLSGVEGHRKYDLVVQQFIKFVENTGADAHLFLGENSFVKGDDGAGKIGDILAAVPPRYHHCIRSFDVVSTEHQKDISAAANLCVVAATCDNFSFFVTDVAFRGLPIMISKHSGIAETFDDLSASMSFDPFDECDLSKKLEVFHALDANLRSEVARRQMNGLKDSMGLKSLSSKVGDIFTNAPPFPMINVKRTPCVFVSEKGVHGDNPEDIPAHYVLGSDFVPYISNILQALKNAQPAQHEPSSDFVPHVINFLRSLNNVTAKLANSVLIFYSQEPPPLNILDALEKGYALAFPVTNIKFGKWAYKDLIDKALACSHIIPIPMAYKPHKALKFYGYALRKTKHISMEDLFHG